MTDQEIIALLKRYHEGNATESEKYIVEYCYGDLNYEHKLTVEELESLKNHSWEQINPIKIKKKKVLWYHYAAILFAIFSISILIYTFSTTKNTERSVIKPGENIATLIFDQQDSVNLNNLKIGDIVEYKGIKIKKLKDGSISCEIDPTARKITFMNKLLVPRGGQYRIKLSDGSLVVLNSESELEFPSQFTDDERRVHMTGEGYFEIAKNKNKPFIVNSKDQEITVLGTKFNIEAYQKDKQITTTLLEGQVKVSSPHNHVILKPGEQSIFDGEKIEISSAKLASNLDWKNDLFTFQSEPLGKIMQKIARWYNIDVVFENSALSEIRFTGSISKYQNIDQVLSILEKTDKVIFSTEHQTIHVKAK